MINVLARIRQRALSVGFRLTQNAYGVHPKRLQVPHEDSWTAKLVIEKEPKG